MRTSKRRLSRNSPLEIVYRKLRFLHKKDFALYWSYERSLGCYFAISVIVKDLSTEFKFIPMLGTLQLIDTDDSSKIKAKNCGLKLFIKAMKNILRGKSFNLSRGVVTKNE